MNRLCFSLLLFSSLIREVYSLPIEHSAQYLSQFESSGAYSSRKLLIELLDFDAADPLQVKVNTEFWEWLKIYESNHLFELLFSSKTLLGEVYGVFYATQAFTSDIGHILFSQGILKACADKTADVSHFRQALEMLSGKEEALLEPFDASSFYNSKDLLSKYMDESEVASLGEKTATYLEFSNEVTTKIQKGALHQTYAQNRNAAKLSQTYSMLSFFVPVAVFTEIYYAWAFFPRHRGHVSQALFSLWRSFSIGTLWTSYYHATNKLNEDSERLFFQLEKAYGAAKGLLAVVESSQKLPEQIRVNYSEGDLRALELFLKECDFVFSDDIPRAYKYGKALAAIRLLLDLRPLYAYLMRGVARADFFTSVALGVELNSELTFVELLDSPEMQIVASDLKPLSMSGEVVGNDYRMGESYPKNIMLSGRSKSGKSYYMRTLGQNIFLAQTLGIVRGEMRLTPVQVVNAFLDAKDKIGQSSYQNERDNIKKLLSDYEKFSTATRSLLFLDKPFRTTNLKKAEYATGKVLPKLFEFENGLSVVSTNLQSLEDLEVKPTFSTINLKMPENLSFKAELGFEVNSNLSASLRLKFQK